jgi:hypothetical protein
MTWPMSAFLKACASAAVCDMPSLLPLSTGAVPVITAAAVIDRLLHQEQWSTSGNTTNFESARSEQLHQMTSMCAVVSVLYQLVSL